MAVSDKLSCSCGESPKQKPVLFKWFINYLQIDFTNYRELMKLKMREYNYSFVSRTPWPEDVSILASTDKPEDTRMWGCKDTNKRTWTRGYEDVRMQVYKQTLWTWGYEDVRMQRYKQAHTNLRIWEYMDASKGTWNWRYEDVRTWGYKQVHLNMRIWGSQLRKNSNNQRKLTMSSDKFLSWNLLFVNIEYY